MKDSLSFYPVTAQIVTVALLDSETDKGFIYYQTPGKPPERLIENNTEFIGVPHEKQLLELFWAKMEKVEQFITFNGRSFDCPFLIVRSAVQRVKPTKNLMPDRYRSNAHIDLMEKLTFLGASRRRFSLHIWCNALGLKLKVEIEVKSDEGISQQKVEQTKVALRELGLDENVEIKKQGE